MHVPALALLTAVLESTKTTHSYLYLTLDDLDGYDISDSEGTGHSSMFHEAC